MKPALNSLLAALAFTLAFTSVSAEAQVCTGSAPFSNGHLRLGIGGGRIGAGFGGTAGDPSAGVRLSFGAARGPFASLAASVVLYGSENPFVREGLATRTTDDASGGLVSFAGGYGISSARGVEFCPFAGFSGQSGPLSYDNCSTRAGGGTTCSGGAEGSGRALWFGGGLGLLANPSPTIALVPFAAAAYVRSTMTVRERNASEDYFELTLGMALVYKRLTIRPTLSLPIGLKQGGSSLGIEFAVNLGPRKSPAAGLPKR